MPVEREAPVAGRHVDAARDWASIQFDLVRIHQFLVQRDKVPSITDDGPTLFSRNALWDAAVTAYGRCNNRGRRPKLEGLVASLPDELRACHRRLMTTRNTEVAHHDHPRDQRTSATVVFDEAGTALGIRVRVYPSFGDENEASFRALVVRLADLAEKKIDSLAAKILAEQDLDELRGAAQPHDGAEGGPMGRLRFTYSSWLAD